MESIVTWLPCVVDEPLVEGNGPQSIEPDDTLQYDILQ